MTRLSILFLMIFPCISNGQYNSLGLSALPGEINTTDNEEIGRWTMDGKAIIFTRITKDQVELRIAYIDSTGRVLKSDKIPFDPNYLGGGHAISPDGKTILTTICNGRESLGGCDLYQSHLINGLWSPPENMSRAYNGARWESQPTYGLDGMSVFFASTRPGGYGGSDIWMVRQISPGILSNPINAGPVINTAHNEGSPFIHFDGRTMYFMRDGTEGYGGYDLYFSRLGVDDQWMPSINMGDQINSSADEGGLAIHPDGKTALITRSTPEHQNDLFEFQLPEQFQSVPIQALYVHVKDENSGKPIYARIEIVDINGRDTLRNSQQADENGNITITLDRNKSYGLIATSGGYIMYSSRLESSDEAIRKMDIAMIPIASSLKKTIALQNIFFESGSAVLGTMSKPELNKLIQTLKSISGMRIEIQGHTDNIGTEESNLKLSDARAKSVYQYLIEHGIDAARLSHKGYGETKPVADNSTETGRRQNRRTEFVILKI